MSLELLLIGGGGPGGMNTFVKEQERRLSKKMDVTVHHTHIGYNSNPVIKYIYSVIVSIYKILISIISFSPDVASINTPAGPGFYRESTYIFISSYLWKCPSVLYIRGSGFDDFLSKNNSIKDMYVSIAFSHADEILVLTNEQKEKVEKYTDSAKIRVFRQCTEVEKFDPRYDHEKAKILYLSNLNTRKGIQDFASSLHEILSDKGQYHPDILVNIAGDGEHRAKVETLAEKFNCVKYHGYVTGDEKYHLFNNSSIFVLPTYSEGFPSAIIEAMAGGNAIVTTNASGITEVVGEENGRTVDPGNVTELTESMIELIYTPEKVQEMGRKNRALVEKEHSWENLDAKLFELYSNLCKRCSGS